MQASYGKVLIGRLSTDGDLLEEIAAVVNHSGVRLGVFSVIGALRSVALGYYDQHTQRYFESVNLKEKFEIAQCCGNISLKDGAVFIHAHITLGRRDGTALAGHVMPGSMIFAAEYYIQELLGPDLIRGYDQQTGLSLWPKGV